MAAALNYVRRLVASVMLVAMASFVLHGAAMAGHAHKTGSPDCGGLAVHAHQAQGHGHGDGVVHVHAEQSAPLADHDHGGAAPDHHAGGGSDGPCCSSLCSATLTMPGVDVVSAPMCVARTLTPESQVGSGIDQGDLKRPPRTRGIA